MKKTVKFTKMQGAGNDYIYVNAMQYKIEDPAAASVAWSRPHTGIGSDGLVLIGNSGIADFSMRIFNADGSEAMMCGNASRCIGKYLYEKGLTDKTSIRLETLSGIRTLKLDVRDGKVCSVCVDMGMATGIEEREVRGAYPHKGIFLSVGNPHFVIFTDDIEKTDLAEEGPEIEHDPMFPDRVNVEFAQVRADGSIRMRVWERGSGITMACGTGACATAVAAEFSGRAGHDTVVEMDGGSLEIETDSEGRILMSGPAETVFEGEIEYDF